MGFLRVRLAVTTVVLALAATAGLCADPSDAPAEVDAAVVLAADVSRSVDDGEFALERRGYAEAIQSQKLLDAISTGPHGAIALAYVEWAGESEQMIVVDWAVIRNAADARAFAAALSGDAALWRAVKRTEGNNACRGHKPVGFPIISALSSMSNSPPTVG